MITQTYNLNLIPRGVSVIVNASQYDSDSRTIVFNIYKGDELFSIPSGSTVLVTGTKLDNTGYEYEISYSGSQVSFDIKQQMTVLCGKHNAEIRITKDGEILGSANFTFDIERAGLNDDTIISETELPIIEEAIEKAEETRLNTLKAEGYAVGTQNGEEVTSESEYYHNNAKYYAEYAEQITSKTYGIKRSLTTSSTEWERTNDSIGLNAIATHDGSSVINDFDNLYPWSDIITVNMGNDGTINAQYGDANFKFDGSNGEVMTYIPPFYYRRWQDDTYEYMQISNRYFDGARHSEGFYIGRYTTSSGAHSKSGVTSQVSTNITTFRQQAMAKGNGWQQLDYHYFLIQMLYLVEYADNDSQSILGQGVVSASAQVASGQLDTLGMKSGCLANAGTTSVIYRGIENVFGNIWQFVDGLNIQDNIAFINYNPQSYQVDKFDGDYTQVGYTNANANGYGKTMGYDSDNPLIALDKEVGGANNTYYSDNYYQNSGNKIALVGGHWNAGAYAGLFYWGLADASSLTYSGVGSRLLKK